MKVMEVMELADEQGDGLLSLKEWFTLVRDRGTVHSRPPEKVRGAVYDHRRGFASLIL